MIANIKIWYIDSIKTTKIYFQINVFIKDDNVVTYVIGDVAYLSHNLRS